VTESYQPRFVSYARSQGMSPSAVYRRDADDLGCLGCLITGAAVIVANLLILVAVIFVSVTVLRAMGVL
jgi:hypothetical protein